MRWELANKSQANKSYAAKVRHFRNRYESLLTDIRACNLTIEEIRARRNVLEEEENKLFEEVAPHTSDKAVNEAEKALNQRKESTTTLLELNTHLPKYLQLTEEEIRSATTDNTQN